MARTAVSEEELRIALIALKNEKPSLGVAKIHSLLLDAHPTWAISEKRVRKILQSENSGHPISRINKSLDVAKWTSKVKVHYFDAFKGKGLVATEKISDGQVLWKEDPFILAPEWYVSPSMSCECFGWSSRDIYDLQTSSRACAFCSTPLGNHSPLHLPCTATPCPAMFCNRLCRAQSEKIHPLLCPARNPASVSLLQFARRTEWMALHALAQCTSKLLLAAQRDDGTLDDDLAVMHGFAELGMEERFRALGCVPPTSSCTPTHRPQGHRHRARPRELDARARALPRRVPVPAHARRAEKARADPRAAHVAPALLLRRLFARPRPHESQSVDPSVVTFS